jgi:MFS family permease
MPAIMEPVVRNHETHTCTPLWAVCALTFLASIGTGVVWNGVSFIVEHEFAFTRQQTLSLYSVLGAMYVVGARLTGRVLRALEHVLSPRGALMLILLAEAAVCSGPWFHSGAWMVVAVSCVISVLSSWLWPIVESYLTAGRHGREMRHAIGWWNFAWTTGVAVALVLLQPFIKEHARMAIVMLGALHGFAALFLVVFTKKPGAHDAEQSAAAVQGEYPLLLRSARMLLPLSYVLNSAVSPLLPYLLDRLNTPEGVQTLVGSTWMWVRIVAMAIMWQVGFWHGRWGTLLLGGLLMTGGFALVVMSPALWVLMAGLAFFGTGMGIVYYAALYYAMAVGRAEVDAGGTHEALIGVGYTVGPIAGLVGLGASQELASAGWKLWDGAGVVTVTCVLIGAGAIAAARPYLMARRRRAEHPSGH